MDADDACEYETPALLRWRRATDAPLIAVAAARFGTVIAAQVSAGMSTTTTTTTTQPTTNTTATTTEPTTTTTTP